MGVHWGLLKDRSLMELTLPGSHNAGSTPDLGAGPPCISDYRLQRYSSAYGGKEGGHNMDAVNFDSSFLPWNINHRQRIAGQLDSGARWFHLKLCNFNEPSSPEADVGKLRHQHRGYTGETLSDTLATMKEFLRQHPKEVLVLGCSNFHNNGSTPPSSVEIAKVAHAVKMELARGGIQLMDEAAMRGPVSAAVAQRKRVAVFFPAPPGLLPEGALASQELLEERWDDAMESGDMGAAASWLVKDLERRAAAPGPAKRGFYVLQANPNNNLEDMFRLVHAGSPESLETWEAPFLDNLGSLVRDAVRQHPGAHINAISTDFFARSRPYEIAMQLMNLTTLRIT